MACEFPQRCGRLDCDLLYPYTLLYFTFTIRHSAARHRPTRKRSSLGATGTQKFGHNPRIIIILIIISEKALIDRIICTIQYNIIYCNVHTHSFNGPLSGITRVSRYEKDKTNLDFTQARDGEWQWYQLGHMQVCTSLQTDNHASTPTFSFFTAGSIYKTGCRGCKADFKRCLKVGMVYSRFQGARTYPQNCSFLWRGIWIPPNTVFLGPTRVHTPNIISIGSSNRQTHRHTDQ